MSDQVKYLLEESEMPTAWYNVQADFATPLPPVIHPGTGQPIGPQDMAPLFPMDIIMQEAAVGPYAAQFIDIPEEVLDIYRLWRPTPLMRARRLEKALNTPAHIYYKYEGASPVGSHKPNTAVPQAYYNQRAGTKRLATETGAGQWGSSVAFATGYFGLEAKVYMVNISYQQKPYRRMMMEAYGATIVASPSKDTAAGRKFLAEDPNHTGSLGIAISEAMEDTVTTPDSSGSRSTSRARRVASRAMVPAGSSSPLQEMIPAFVISVVIGFPPSLHTSAQRLRQPLRQFPAQGPSLPPLIRLGCQAWHHGAPSKFQQSGLFLRDFLRQF